MCFCDSSKVPKDTTWIIQFSVKERGLPASRTIPQAHFKNNKKVI